MNKKFKAAMILSVVVTSIVIFVALISLITLGSKEVFKEKMLGLFEIEDDTLYLLGVELTSLVGLTTEQINEEIALLTATYYSMNLICSVLAIIFAGIALAFSIVCIKDCNLDVNTFRQRKKFHITIGVMLIFVFITTSFFVSGIIYSSLSLITDLVHYASLVNFILVFVGIKSRPMYHYIPPEPANAESINNENNVIDEVSPVSSESKTQDEETIKKLQEGYELLAKLEKSYRNNEISYEDYERMKNTILENFKK